MTSDILLLFGDQTIEYGPLLVKIASEARKGSRFVHDFLQEATDVILAELGTLDPDDKQQVEPFPNLVQFTGTGKQSEDQTGILQTVLSCVARLGELILHVEHDLGILRPSHGTKVHALGFCTGLLPAAALAAARNVQDLVYLSTYVVRVAFRLGVEAYHSSLQIESVHGTWGYLVVGQQPDEIEAALHSYIEQAHIPNHKAPHVAVAADGWSAVFGPPSIMSKLVADPAVFHGASVTELYKAINSVHAAHMPPIYVEKVLGTSELLDRELSPSLRIMSTSSSAPFRVSSLRELLKEMLQDIMNRRLELSGTLRGFASSIAHGSKLRLAAIGAATALAAVQSVLESCKAQVTILDRPEHHGENSARSGSGKVAIVGLAGRFPGSEDVHTFWQSLLDGREFHEKVPENRFDLDAWHQAMGEEVPLPYACFLKRPGQFDSRLFNISPREAAQIDPTHRLLLTVSYEALESAGYAPNSTPATEQGRVSTFYGQCSDDWRDINHQRGIDTYYIPATARAFAAGRLHYYFKWEGPASTIDSACGSSAVALSMACSALLNRDSDMVLAGGGFVSSSPDSYAGLTKGGFLSPTGSCKTFRNDADGYCRGESVAAVVLKRLEDAQNDNDNIIAVIEGHARNHSAFASSLTHPHQGSQERVFRQAMTNASVDPLDVGYVETHGTGTTAGDACEARSIDAVLGNDRSSDNPLVLGGVKANIGHGEAAAGVVALVKVLMILRNGGQIPPQPGISSATQINPIFTQLEAKHIHVSDGKRQLKPGKKALLNCFDATGGNISLVLAQPPTPPDKDIDPRTQHVVVCSGHTFTTMKKNQRRLLDYVMAHRDEHLSHLAYTTTARRGRHHSYRSAFVAGNMQELGRLLLEDQSKTDENVRKRGSIVFTFTGQGAVYRGMGNELFRTSDTFRRAILDYQEICTFHGFPSFIELISEDIAVVDKDACEPGPNLNYGTAAQQQLALTALQLGLAHLLRRLGLQPNLVIGHSIGEYAALCIAGVLSVSETFYMVGKRALLLEEHCEAGSHAMLAIPLPASTLESLLDREELDRCCIACKNSPRITVVSGPVSQIVTLKETVAEYYGMDSKFVPVQYGFHSQQMDQILDSVESLGHLVNFSTPKIPVASTLYGEVITSGGKFGPAYLPRHTREPVDFTGAVEACRSGGLVDENSLWIEIGPDPACTSMVRSILTTTDKCKLLPTMSRKASDWKMVGTLLASLYCHGMNIDWQAYHGEYKRSLSLVELPAYAFDFAEYWSPFKTNKPQAFNTEAQGSNNNTKMLEQAYLTPFLQHVTHETVDNNGVVTAHFASKLSHPEMIAVAQAHLVNLTPILPGTVFAEMAYAAADYLVGKRGGRSSKSPASSWVLSDLQINRPVIITSADDERIVRVVANYHIDHVAVAFSIDEADGNSPIGNVDINFDRNEGIDAKTSLSSSFLARSRMHAVIKAVEDGCGHVLRKSLIYKLFARHIVYGNGFQGLERCFLGEDMTEAAASVKLPDSPASTRDPRAFNGYWRDAIFHLAGFMLNGHPDGPEDFINMLVGVKRVCFEEELSADESYDVYTYMGKKGPSVMGDVYVFRDQRLVALCSDMVFRQVPVQHKDMQPKLNATAKQVPQGIQGSESPNGATHRKDDDSMSNMVAVKKPTQQKETPVELDVAEVILKAVANETGWAPEDIDDNQVLADLGVDSLMNIVIAAKVRAEAGVEFPLVTFRACVTVGDIKKSFGSPKHETSAKPQQPDHCSSEFDSATGSDESPMTEATGTPNGQSSDASFVELDHPDGANEINKITLESCNGKHASQAVLIQGVPEEKKPFLFLIPDGSGSVASFSQLPQFESEICIYGLHSPFVSDPDEFATIEQGARLYIDAIKSKQPKGPYLLGGFSGGCIFAYEAARILLEAGETVLGLIIIDMHPPRLLPEWINPTAELYKYWCESAGLGDPNAHRPQCEKQDRHFLNCFRALTSYRPKPMHPSRPLKNGTLIIWATKGMIDIKQEDLENVADPLAIGHWLFLDRTEFGPRGWEKLVGDRVECVKIEGHHQSIMLPPDAHRLVQALDRGVAKLMRT